MNEPKTNDSETERVMAMAEALKKMHKILKEFAPDERIRICRTALVLLGDKK